MDTIYAGWLAYQTALTTALQPLTAEQLALRAAPGLRSLAQLAAHMVAARANWFYRFLQEGGEAFARLGEWDRPTAPAPSAADLIQGFETTWHAMQAAIARWSPADWQQTFTHGHPYEPAVITRQWVIWHLIEHDLHHGGELSLTLGVHALNAPDL